MPCFKYSHFSPIVNSNMMNNCSFPMFVDNHAHAFRALCNKCLSYSPIVASKMLSNCSFKCLVCNNASMLSNEISPIAFSSFGDFSSENVENFPSFTLYLNHPHMSYFQFDYGVFGDMHIKRYVMMDDVFIYHKQNFFIWYFRNVLMKRHIPMGIYPTSLHISSSGHARDINSHG